MGGSITKNIGKIGGGLIGGLPGILLGGVLDKKTNANNSKANSASSAAAASAASAKQALATAEDEKKKRLQSLQYQTPNALGATGTAANQSFSPFKTLLGE